MKSKKTVLFGEDNGEFEGQADDLKDIENREDDNGDVQEPRVAPQNGIEEHGEGPGQREERQAHARIGSDLLFYNLQRGLSMTVPEYIVAPFTQ